MTETGRAWRTEARVVALVKHLFERRIPQVLAIYAGASWGLIEFAGFLVEEFLLSPHWPRFVLAALLLLLPSVLMLAWFHGRPGRDDVPLAEKIGIPANLAVAALALLLLFGGRDLGAATETILVRTEDGEIVERVVAKTEFRKKAALFPFDAGPGLDDEDAWITYLAPIALEMDLAADEFFQAIEPSLFAYRLAELGFPTLRDVPLALKREVSEDYRAGLLASGTVDREDGDYRVTLTLHEADRVAMISQTVHRGPDFLALVDEMSVVLANALDIPDRSEIDDLPVRERLTSNRGALEAFGRGSAELFVGPLDLGATLEAFEAATVLDPTFALAQYQLAMLLLADNRPEEAVDPIRKAVDNAYRLPERTSFQVRSDYYFVTQQTDRAWAVIEMWVELYPEDSAALQSYTGVQMIRGDWEGLIQTLGTLYRLNPGDHLLLFEIADAHRRLGEDEAALDALERYLEQVPNDHAGYVEMARILERRGEHEEARAQVERALNLQPTMSELVVALATLDRETGRFEEAATGYERALALASTPAERVDVLGELKDYHRFRGQLDDAIRTAGRWLEDAALVWAPVEIAQDRMSEIDLHVEAGRNEEARQLFETLSAELQPPLSDFSIPRWRIRLELGAGDADAALAAYHAAIDAMEANDFGVQRPLLLADLGRIDELRGDYESAVGHYREAMTLDPGRNLHRNAGGALRKAGRVDEALEELREALRRRPAEPRAHLEMALALEADGDIEAAVDHLLTALNAWESADTSFAPAREARDKLAELESRS